MPHGDPDRRGRRGQHQIHNLANDASISISRRTVRRRLLLLLGEYRLGNKCS